MSAATAVTVAFNTNRVDPPLDMAAPVVTSLSPASRLVKQDGFTLTVAGSGFTRTSTVNWNGTSRATTFVSATQLRTKIGAADLAAVGTIPVSVVTPAPGGGASGTLSFTVGARTPRANSLSPTRTAAGNAGFTIAVKGAWFVPSSRVRWNGADRPTTFVSASEVRATIAAADLTSPHTAAVSVFTPTPGGGTSGSRNFTVTAASTSSTAASSTTASSTTAAASSTLPAAPGNPSVTTRAVDATGVTFDITWSAAAGATSYRYVAGFGDGSAGQQGTVTGLLTFQLRMPYHASGAAIDGFVCVRSANAAGQSSADHACAAVPVPAR
jgi:hypothetical protein